MKRTIHYFYTGLLERSFLKKIPLPQYFFNNVVNILQRLKNLKLYQP